MSYDPVAPKLLPLPRRPRHPDRPRPEPMAWPASSRLPTPLTSLVGREAEVVAARAMLIDGGVRLLTLTGPGGVGKTRLALRIAEESAAAFPDGVVFVPLAPITDPALVLPAIARELGLKERAGQPVAEILAGYLRHRRLLLVLDNVEQVAGAAPYVAALLGGCPGLTVLATSRTRLRVSGEHRFPVSPLALPNEESASRQVGLHPQASASEESSVRQFLTPDTRHPTPLQEIERSAAVQLFVERARAVEPGFVLDAHNAPTVAAICRRLDGLPLAIELAAVHIRFFTATELLARLAPALPLLSAGPADAPDRLRTMRNAIAWSYNLLTPAQQLVLRRLSVFVGGCTLGAAEAVAGGSHQPSPAQPLTDPVEQPGFLETLASLVDASLVRRHDAGGGLGGETRLTMLETIREFAWERLAESGEATAIRAAHAATMANLAERAEPHLLGPDERQWEARVEAELGNVRAALAWALEHDVAMALRIAAPLWIYWSVTHLPEGRQWLQAALAQPSSADDLLRAQALTTEGALACLLGDFAAGETAARLAVALAQAADAPIVEARARWMFGASRLSAGQPEGAMRELDHALTLFAQATTSADRARTAYTRLTRAMLAFMLGEVEQGIDDCERALAEVRAAGSDAVTIVILSYFGGQLVDLGETARARELLADALALVVDYPGFLLTGQTLFGLALIAAREGAAATAARRLGAAEELRIRNGLVLPTFMKDRIDRASALVTEALGAEAFAVAWEAGRANPDVVIAEALGDRDAIAAAAATDVAAPTAHDRQPLTLLSPRERDVLRLLVAGHSDKEIAAALGLSRRTASFHVAAIRTKLGAPSRTAAATIAVRDGLV